MTTTVVPPQAYTKADLTKAYEWLQKQPATIQDMATSADTLMGLYRKALLYGSSSISPKSSASTTEFKSELKELAGQISSFDSEGPKEKPVYSSTVKYNSSGAGLPPWAETKVENHLNQQVKTEHKAVESSNSSVVLDTYNGTASFTPPQQEQHIAPQRPKPSQQTLGFESTESSGLPLFQSQRETPPVPAAMEIPDLSQNYNYPSPRATLPQEDLGLDANSKAMISEVKRKLNLSSDPEAMRMMLSIGYERIKALF